MTQQIQKCLNTQQQFRSLRLTRNSKKGNCRKMLTTIMTATYCGHNAIQTTRLFLVSQVLSSFFLLFFMISPCKCFAFLSFLTVFPSLSLALLPLLYWNHLFMIKVFTQPLALTCFSSFFLTHICIFLSFSRFSLRLSEFLLLFLVSFQQFFFTFASFRDSYNLIVLICQIVSYIILSCILFIPTLYISLRLSH